MEDRRQRRSERCDKALRYQLETTQRLGALEAVVLSGAARLIDESAGDPEVCVALGAIARIASKSMRAAMPLPEPIENRDVAVRSFSLFGENLFLAAVGGTSARDVVLSCTIQGVHRILSSN